MIRVTRVTREQVCDAFVANSEALSTSDLDGALTEIKDNPPGRRTIQRLAPSIHAERNAPMKTTFLILAIAGALAAGAVQAQDMLKAKGCLGCHDVEKKKIGPALKDIAAQYKGDKTAEAKLVAKIKEAKGHPKVNASDDELKAAVSQVLATK
jgi:cytochrome c